MKIKVPQNKVISGGGKDGGREGDSSSVHWIRANWGSININA